MNEQRFEVKKVLYKRIGIMDDNKIITIETYADNLALDIVEELKDIREGIKDRESTTIDLDLRVLDSLSRAISALKRDYL